MRNSRAVFFSGLVTSQHKNSSIISCSNDTEDTCRVALPDAEASSQLLLSHWVMFNSFQPRGLCHVRLLCPPSSLGGGSHSCPSSWWCYLSTSSSATLFSFCLQSFPTSGSFSNELVPPPFLSPNLFVFNWRKIAPQYRVGLCHISTCISRRYTRVPAPFKFPPTSHPFSPL